MSRLSKKPILLPTGVTLREEQRELVFKGPRGEEAVPRMSFVSIEKGEGSLRLYSDEQTKQARANVGTMTALIKNAILGVMQGFEVVLEVEGVGFRPSLEGKTLVLALGFVNPVRFDPPEGVVIVVEKNTIKLSGNNKQLVTQAAARIRAFKKPEPYKGKGIRYKGEVIRRKVGKKAAAAKA